MNVGKNKRLLEYDSSSPLKSCYSNQFNSHYSLDTSIDSFEGWDLFMPAYMTNQVGQRVSALGPHSLIKSALKVWYSCSLLSQSINFVLVEMSLIRNKCHMPTLVPGKDHRTEKLSFHILHFDSKQNMEKSTVVICADCSSSQKKRGESQGNVREVSRQKS